MQNSVNELTYCKQMLYMIIFNIPKQTSAIKFSQSLKFDIFIFLDVDLVSSFNAVSKFWLSSPFPVLHNA